MNTTHPGLLALLLLVPTAAVAGAQGSTTAASNLSVADGAWEQAQPKLVPTADGGSYVSWFDSDPAGSPAFGYDVRLQRLDADGNEVWAHGGVLVADRGFSSTQDYGLSIDPAGNALLAFRDDRGTGVQITAARIEPDGTMSWGASGIQLTSTTAFVAAPKIAGATDGKVFVAWTQDADVHVQRLDELGATTWSPDVVFTPTTGTWSASDLHASDSAAAVLSMVLQTGGFGSPRHIFAQKLDATGASLWGANHVAVFDGGSLQFGNFPTFVPDGSGGAVFGWYSSSPSLECFAQRVLANGTEAFPHNGVAASTSAERVRVSPSVAFDPSTSETFLAYVEQNALQSMDGVSAQKYDASGNRLWTALGKSVVALGTDDLGEVNTLTSNGGAMVYWTAAPSFGQDVVRAARLASDGSLALGPFDASSTRATKFRLQAARSTLGFAALAWQDDGAGTPDILAQRVNDEGTLGLPLVQDVATISLAAGGSAQFSLAAGTPNASGLYWLFGTTAGTSPGQPLAPSGLTLPLNFSGYFLFTVLNPNALIPSSLAFLDGAGTAALTLTLPAGLDPGLSGIVFHHAFVLLDLVSFQASYVSNAARLELVP